MSSPIEFEQGRRNHFVEFANEYKDEMRFLFYSGKLRKFGERDIGAEATRGDWDNVLKHNLVVGHGVNTLGHLLQLEPTEINRLTRNGLLHDWEKHLEISVRKGWTDFTPVEVEAVKKDLSKFGLDPNLQFATGDQFTKAVDAGKKLTLGEKIMFFIDDISRGDEIVPLLDRINEVAARRQDLGEEYWNRERRVGKQIEQDLYNQLPEKVQKEVGTPENLPLYLKSQIESQYKTT